MKDHRPTVLDRLRRLRGILGPGSDRVVVVGGSAPATYDLQTVKIRETEDVDLVVRAASYAEYAAAETWLAGFGFDRDTDAGVVCSFVGRDLRIDLMPTPFEGIGFNPWYAGAYDHRRLDMGTGMFVIPPMWFLATKLTAFLDRGAADPYMSHDLEDIVTVLRGDRSVWAELAAGPDAVHRFVRYELRRLTDAPDAEELFSGHFDQDAASQAGVAAFVARLRALLSPQAR